jgi:hypothetical protein
MPEQPPGVASITSQTAPATETGKESVKQEVAAAPAPEPPAEVATAPTPPPLPQEPTPPAMKPEVHQAEKPATAHVATPVAAEIQSPFAPQLTRRRSYVDTTASPCFGHSDDYRTLTGQLQHSRLSKGWRLRFASVDEVDPYGGSVTLVEDEHLTDMKDGQYVRVHGHFLNAEDRAIAPPYQIDSIHALDRAP